MWLQPFWQVQRFSRKVQILCHVFRPIVEMSQSRYEGSVAVYDGNCHL